MMKKKIIFVIIIVILAIIMAVAILVLSDPLRRSAERIRIDMLKHTPIGMSMEEVIKVIESNNNWEIGRTRDNGYIIRNRLPDIDITRGNENTVGVKSMEVYIGSYNFFYFAGRTIVWIYYAFDEDSKLVDIAVGKGAIHI
jgi:uncharacterized membrane protein